MNRLRHSQAGLLRSFQMSSTGMFVFVEGTQLDPFFYGKLCEATPELVHKYEIVTANHIQGGSGGKQSLLTFYDYLRRKRALLSSLGANKTAIVFFLDKDLDDLKRIRRRSSHVIYTEHYDVQNYVFLNGNLVDGSAAAASVDPGRLDATFGDSHSWCRKAAAAWIDWLTLCLRMVEDGIRCEANYRVASPVQSRPAGAADSAKYASLTRSIARRAGLPVSELRQRLASTRTKVDRYFLNNLHHKIFKGKWFATIVEDQIKIEMAGQAYDKNGVSTRLACSIAATLDFKDTWAMHLRDRLAEIASQL